MHLQEDDTVLAAARSDPTGLMRGLNGTTIDAAQRIPDLSSVIKGQSMIAGRLVSVAGLSHYILGSDDGLERSASCRRNPRPKNRNEVENAACQKKSRL